MMSANSEMVLNFLKKNYGKEFSKHEIAEALGISLPAVTGSINGLASTKSHPALVVKTREEQVEKTPATETRKATYRTVIYHTLTEEGLAYDPVAEEERIQAEKAAEKARKAAEKAAKNA